jgi:PsbP-like protein
MLKINLFLCLVIFTALSFTVYPQTENWNQYSSSMAGYSVKYPWDWKADQEEGKGKVWRLTINSPGQRDDDVWEHNSITICSKSKSDSFENLDRCADHHISVKENKFLSEKVLNINGLNIRRLETREEFRTNGIYFLAIISTEERDYKIAGVFRKIFNLDRMAPVFDQMLETFRTLKEISALNYRNEKYDFALTYPTSWKSCPITESTIKDEEEILILVPEGRLCNGGNYIVVSRMTKFSYEKNNRNLKEFLKDNFFTSITPYVEFGNIHAAIGEKISEGSIYRERYFYTNYPTTYELLKISEMYQLNNDSYQKEGKEILTTARRFLKNQ